MRPNRSFMISAALLAITGILLIVYIVVINFRSSVIVSWETATELETAGYFIYRSESPDGPFEKITEEMIPASTSPLTGGSYEYTDTETRAGNTYYYQLEEIETSGTTNIEGPIEGMAAYRGIPEGVLGIILLVFAWLTRRVAIRGAINEQE